MNCGACGGLAGDRAEISKSGDVLCEGCARTAALASLEAVAAKRSSDWAGERRCASCKGVATAGAMVDYHSRQTLEINGIPVGSEQIEEGSETVFRCERCGREFRVLNRLRRNRIVIGAFQLSAAGGVIGLLVLGISRGHVLGWVAFLVLLSVAFLYGWSPLVRDARIRAENPPIS